MIRELSYQDSKSFIAYFEELENPSPWSTDWVDVEEKNATYIWFLELEDIIEKPLGFLSYKILVLPNTLDFVYIVKIYVLKTHRGENPILIDNERVSKILFDEIDRKDVNILTLESACEDLDIYYKRLGFEYNVDISSKFATIISTREEILYRRRENPSNIMSDTEKEIFGENKSLK